jgi:hypothetical protein
MAVRHGADFRKPMEALSSTSPDVGIRRFTKSRLDEVALRQVKIRRTHYGP